MVIKSFEQLWLSLEYFLLSFIYNNNENFNCAYIDVCNINI